MKNNLNVLQIQFSNSIQREEISFFRGSIVNAVQQSGADLFS